MRRREEHGKIKPYPRKEDSGMSGIELVIKIGSMALIRREDNDIDYNIFARLCGPACC